MLRSAESASSAPPIIRRGSPPVPYLVDAGPLVGAFWPADQWHDWSRETLGALGASVCTTETVFAVTAHHLKSSLPALLQLFAAVDSGLVQRVAVFPQPIGRAAEIVTDYRPPRRCGRRLTGDPAELYLRAKWRPLERADFTLDWVAATVGRGRSQ